MEFCLLGPLVVRSGDTLLPVRRGKQRAVLAALLLAANRSVTVDELAETLWGQVPPPSAPVTIRNYVKRLRHALGETGRARIQTQPHGYLIRVDAGELDVSRFEALLGSARAAARDSSWDQAAGQARSALALWRGEPLADVEADTLALREVPRLAELRLQALEARIGADLHLGRHAEVISELQRLTSAHPLREHLHALLMLALYRGGRQSEALAAYQRARRIVVDELGAEPGTGLRELHQRMLAADPGLASPEPSPATPPGPAAAPGPPAVVPRQLPGTVRHFTGRAGELAALTGLLEQAGQTPGTVVISAIGGTAGVGKTALAVHWAHRVAERYPDGQLYVNLRGYDPGRPMAAADALAGFLRALGVPGQDIPADEDERAARYRSLLAGRRLLVVLDNARSVAQVRPLLPGTPACAAVVTSRDSLAGLIARDGAARLDLDLLPLADATRLLRTLIGGRADADPGAAATLAGQCARLPLALRVAAELAAARPAASLASLVAELADQQRRLDLLNADGDPRTAVRAVFSWSYRHLDAATARTFRLLGAAPSPDWDQYAAAALTGTGIEQAGQVLGLLARAHLIQVTAPGRYGMHDLLRAYARELAAQNGADEQTAALTRLLDYYLHVATAAVGSLFPADHQASGHVPGLSTPVPPVDSAAAARAWLDTERASLLAAAAHAAGNGRPGYATGLASTLFRYLTSGGHFAEAITVHSHARRAAQHARDRDGEAAALVSLGVVRFWQGRGQQATDYYQQALALYRGTGDQAGQARALNSLGLADTQQGRYEQAMGDFQAALALHRALGDRIGEARALGNLGFVHSQQGRYQEAGDHLQQAIAVYRDIGHRIGEARALANLGHISMRLGGYPEAREAIERALRLFAQGGDRPSRARALASLGEVDVRQGRHQQALGHHRQALALCQEMGDQAGEAVAHNGLGEAFLASEQPGSARTEHTAALGLAAQTGDKYEQARAHNGLAHACRASGEPGPARYHWAEALSLYTSLGAPEAEQVRALLNGAVR
jgi:DNA-binding SARP family transcriptional activator/Tfp pilus assembly protein PilF